MGAVLLGTPAYITRAPSWSRSMFKIGALANPPGKIPPALMPYLLKPGDVSSIANRCRADGKGGASMVRCINSGVAMARSKRR